MEPAVSSNYRYTTWLKCISLACKLCGHTKSFDSKRFDGSVAVMTEITDWMELHWKVCPQREKEDNAHAVLDS